MIRHNDLRDLTAKLLSDLCSDTEVKQKFAVLSGDGFKNRTALCSNEARRDIQARI